MNFNKKLNNYTSLSIISYIALMLAASISLIFVFDFPDILREPVEVMLSKFYSNRSLIVPAYYLFVLSGISFIFMVLMLHKTIVPKDSVAGFLALVFGVLFGLLSNLGFIRWPFLMDYLSQAFNNPSTTETGRESIKLIFNSFHNYAGVAVGENFAFWFEGFWVIFISGVLKMRKDLFPPIMPKLGYIIGSGMLIYTFEQFGGIFEGLGNINMLIHSGFLVWLSAIAILLLKNKNAVAGKPLIGKVTGIGLTLFYAVLLAASYL